MSLFTGMAHGMAHGKVNPSARSLIHWLVNPDTSKQDQLKGAGYTATGEHYPQSDMFQVRITIVPFQIEADGPSMVCMWRNEQSYITCHIYVEKGTFWT